MSVISSSISPKPAAAAEKPMLTPEQFIEQLHALRDQVPDFVQLPDNREIRKLRQAARAVNAELAREALSAVGATDLVQNAIGSTPEELRQAEAESSRWLSAESELRAVLRGLSAANAVRRYRIAYAVLQAYRISRTLAGDEKFSDLVPHVETMARIKNRRRSKTPETSKPAPPPDDPQKQ
jgi:hypothetical protein